MTRPWGPISFFRDPLDVPGGQGAVRAARHDRGVAQDAGAERPYRPWQRAVDVLVALHAERDTGAAQRTAPLRGGQCVGLGLHERHVRLHPRTYRAGT